MFNFLSALIYFFFEELFSYFIVNPRPVVPASPFKIYAPISCLPFVDACIQYCTVFKKCGPPCCEILATGLF